MKTRLNQLSLAAFIELSCGDMSVLIDKEEEVDDTILKAVKLQLMYEYKSIVNPAGMKSVLIDKEEESKLNARILMLRICLSLCMMGETEDVRKVMEEYEPGYSKSDRDVEKDITGKLREAEFLKKRISDTKVAVPTPDDDDIRRAFDKEIAIIMTYFKMSIDINATNASVYANIVNQASEDMKRKLLKK